MIDVAKEAGVSIATVSRVVSGCDIVSPNTQKKVNDAIKALGYEMNISARNLSIKQRESIGLIVPVGGCLESEGGMLVDVMVKLAELYNKKLIIKEADISPEGECQALSSLNQQGCAVITFLPESSSSLEIEQFISMISSPVIVIDRRVNNAVCVWSDYFSATHQATDLLIRYGHKNIAIAGDFDKYADRKLIQGYCAALKLHKVPCQTQHIINYGKNYDEAVSRFVNSFKSRDDFTAIIIFDMLGYYSFVKYLSINKYDGNYHDIFCVTSKRELALEAAQLSTIQMPLNSVCLHVKNAVERILKGGGHAGEFCIKGQLLINSKIRSMQL